MRNHWLVGAMEGGKVDHTHGFVEGDCWKSYTPEGEETPAERRLWREAEMGDRIGIKRRRGDAAQPVVVTSTGTIRSVDRDAKRMAVDWTEFGMSNVIEGHGCTETVCGPYAEEEREWLGKLFIEEDEEADWASFLAASWAGGSDDPSDNDYAREEGEPADEAR